MQFCLGYIRRGVNIGKIGVRAGLVWGDVETLRGGTRPALLLPRQNHLAETPR